MILFLNHNEPQNRETNLSRRRRTSLPGTPQKRETILSRRRQTSLPGTPTFCMAAKAS